MKYSQNLRALSLGLFFSAACIAAACGDSEDGDGAGTPGASGSTGSPSTGSGNLQPGASGSTGTNGTGEGNPGVIPLDPNRDTSVPVNLVQSGAVACGGGGDFCVQPALTCCIAGGGMNATFSCAPDPTECPADTVSTASCSSQVSCGDSEVCCRVGNGGGGGPGGNPTTTSCAATCPDGADQLCLDDAECGDGNVCDDGVCEPPACTATSCGDGELCCRGLGGGGAAAPACAAPGGDGLCPANRRQVCDDAAQCPTDNTCSPLFGGGGGGFTVCTPPPCTPTSCADGQVCCVGGGLGGNPTCGAPAATGACNGNSRLVCITNAECAPSPGTECLPPPNGAGALSCRVPPPVVADAGADGG